MRSKQSVQWTHALTNSFLTLGLHNMVLASEMPISNLLMLLKLKMILLIQMMRGSCMPANALGILAMDISIVRASTVVTFAIAYPWQDTLQSDDTPDKDQLDASMGCKHKILQTVSSSILFTDSLLFGGIHSGMLLPFALWRNPLWYASPFDYCCSSLGCKPHLWLCPSPLFLDCLPYLS